MQMYKVFFNDSFLILAPKGFQPQEGMKSTEYQNFVQIEKWVSEAEFSGTKLNIAFICDNPEEILTEITHKYCYIKAAGGLVKSKKSKHLFIFRRGKWDLPKGKIDQGESLEHAAIREVIEETGLKNVFITHKIDDTFHFYKAKSKIVIKKTCWFAMKNMGDDTLIPQKEEDIEEAKWVKQDQIKKLKENMFSSVIDIVEKSKIENIN